MGKVTALGMDTIHEGSGHQMTGMAVSVCVTPAAPSPRPIPYPTLGSVAEGIIDPCMRTTIEGRKVLTVGGCMKACHGNEPGTLKEVVSLNSGGPCFPWLGAPTVFIELGMAGITGSMGQMNKSITVGTSGSASGAGSAGDGGGGSSSGSASGPSVGGPSGPSSGGGGGGGSQHEGAQPGKSSSPKADDCTTEGHPVDVASGAVVDSATDLTAAGPIPLVWSRHYSSRRYNETDAALGPGWAFSYEQHIEEGKRALVLRDGEGRSLGFEKVAPGEATFHRRERLTLRREGEHRYHVTSLDTGLTQVFTRTEHGGKALLRAIRDAHGNEVTLAYEGERLTRVTGVAGRELHVSWSDGRIHRVELRAAGKALQWVSYAYAPGPSAKAKGGLLYRAIDAEGGIEGYEYDDRAAMIATTLKNDERFTYAYNARGGCCKTGGEGGLHEVALRRAPEARTTEAKGEEPEVWVTNPQETGERYDHER